MGEAPPLGWNNLSSAIEVEASSGRESSRKQQQKVERIGVGGDDATMMMIRMNEVGLGVKSDSFIVDVDSLSGGDIKEEDSSSKSKSNSTSTSRFKVDERSNNNSISRKSHHRSGGHHHQQQQQDTTSVQQLVVSSSCCSSSPRSSSSAAAAQPMMINNTSSIITPGEKPPFSPRRSTGPPTKDQIDSISTHHHQLHQQHQITIIKTGGQNTDDHQITRWGSGSRRFNTTGSFKRSSQTSSTYLTCFSNPKRVLLFFATLSSIGTILLIFFTLSIAEPEA